MGDEFRIEHDALGEVRVPAGAYYGAETVRAVDNFRISGRRARPELVRFRNQPTSSASATASSSTTTSLTV